MKNDEMRTEMRNACQSRKATAENTLRYDDEGATEARLWRSWNCIWTPDRGLSHAWHILKQASTSHCIVVAHYQREATCDRIVRTRNRELG
jgi:hypothetical protein